jgi:hypothetical protein
MLNRVLRAMKVDFIVKTGFFVQDLHNHVAALHVEQCAQHHHSNLFTVYRGQGLSQADFDQLMKTQGGLLSFNNFLSASLDQAVSLAFAESNQSNPDLIGVLFKKEVLFSMHSVIRI